MSDVCEGKDCVYEGWQGDQHASTDEFLAKLRDIGIVPTGEGPERQCVGSPYRTPLPKVVRLCCLDSQICKKSDVKFGGLNTNDEVNEAVNRARDEQYQAAGLPSVAELSEQTGSWLIRHT